MSALFSPLQIRHVAFRNRVVMPPMVCDVRPDLGTAAEAGQVTPGLLEHYGRRADAGTGMIIVEATAVGPHGRCWPGGLGIYADDFVPGLARLAERIHAGGAVASIQLVHGGPQGKPELCGGETVGPSAVPPKEEAPTPRALTVEEIQRIEQDFADAAVRAEQAGFDIVEVHGAHGFLLDSFLSARRNTRTDAYGGNLAGRMRMLLETCRLVRERLGADTLLDCRISIFNKVAEGFTVDDLRQLVSGLEATGLDLLHVSTDGAFKGYFDTDKPIGKWVKEMTRLPIIVAGGLGDPRDANRAIAEGIADFTAIGHAMLDDPEWTRHAEEADLPPGR